MLAFGLPLGASMALASLVNTGVRALVEALASPEALGLYTAAFMLVQNTLNVVAGGIASAGYSLAVRAVERGDAQEARQQLLANGTLLLAVLTPAALGMTLTADATAELLVGQGYTAGVAALTPWMAAAAFLGGVRAHYLDHAFQLGRRPSLQVGVTAVAAALGLGLGAWLIPRQGPVGAAVAATAAMAVSCVHGWIAGRKAYPVPFPARGGARVLLAALVMAAALLLTPGSGTAGLAGRVALGGLSYAAAATALNVLGARRPASLGGPAAPGRRAPRARSGRLAVSTAHARLLPLPLAPATPGVRPERLGRLTQAFIMFAFSIYSGALAPSIRYARGDEQLPPGQTEVANTASQAVILVVLALFFARRWRVLAASARPLAPYAAILLLCAASTLWSQYPFLTFRRCVTLTVCVAFGVFCADRAGLAGTIRILGRTTLALGALSLAAYVAVPGVGHEVALGYSDAMRGVFAQKNTLGESAVLGIVCYASMALAERRLRLPVALAISLLLGCIVLAKSATSLVIAAVVLACAGLAASRRTRLGPLALYALFATLVSLAFVGATAPDLLFALVQRDASFTGRLPLWQMSLDAVAARPWLGYGYSAFWNEGSRAVQYIWQAIAWRAPSAHNGYMDILLQLGIPGLLLYLWLWTRIVRGAVRLAGWRGGVEPAWLLLFMLTNVLLNLDEGPLPYPDQFTAMMPVALIFLGQTRRSWTPRPGLGGR